MRKHTRRRPIAARAPMLVVAYGIPELSITERLSVEAIVNGYADTDHFDNLADCRDILTLAATERQDRNTLVACELGYVALIAVKTRYDTTGRMGATGEEIKALRLLVDVSEDFWKRQSGSVFARHYTALKTARKQPNTNQTEATA